MCGYMRGGYRYLKPYLPQWGITCLKKIFFFLCKIRYDKEIKKRSHLSIFDYRVLAQDMPLVTREYGYNAFYGLADIVKKIMHFPLNQPLDGVIEHGFCIPLDDISEIDKPPRNVYVMGKVRQEFLQRKFPNKKIYSIGPYIQYVQPFYSEYWLIEEKKRLGKTLLVFPSHSTHHVTMDFNEKKFLDEIERIRITHEYCTVLVCLYWKDVLLRLDKKFSNMGYEFVTAGHIYDPNFMPRLKSILLLADVAVGNSLGTNIGYSIACGVPYYFYDIQTNYVGDLSRGECVNDLDEETMELRRMATRYLGDYRESITVEAESFVRAYWGDW